MTDKTVVIHQPDFLPYLGFFHRFLESDIYVVLDHVQFVKGTSQAWTHRDKIRTKKGEEWISLSVKKCGMETPINQVELSENNDWKNKCLNLLKENYRKSKYFNDIYPYLEELFQLECKKMVDFNMASIRLLMNLLDIEISVVYSSTLDPVGSKNEMLVDIIKKIEANRYLSGVGARTYMEVGLYNEAGIEVSWQEFHHPVYPQMFEGFIPALSSVDILFNCGIEKSRHLLRNSA